MKYKLPFQAVMRMSNFRYLLRMYHHCQKRKIRVDIMLSFVAETKNLKL